PDAVGIFSRRHSAHLMRHRTPQHVLRLVRPCDPEPSLAHYLLTQAFERDGGSTQVRGRGIVRGYDRNVSGPVNGCGCEWGGLNYAWHGILLHVIANLAGEQTNEKKAACAARKALRGIYLSGLGRRETCCSRPAITCCAALSHTMAARSGAEELLSVGKIRNVLSHRLPFLPVI